MSDRVVILAGVPSVNPWVYRRTRFLAHDTMVFIEMPGEGSFLMLRDIEIERARKVSPVDHFHSPGDFAPAGGLSGDRETATAQASAELLRRHGVKEAWTDRSLPMIFAHFLSEAGITVRCDPEMGVLERRAKDAHEVEQLRAAQAGTERAMRMACELIANAKAESGGVLQHDGEALTSERVRSEISVFLLRAGFDPCEAIVAGGPVGADCHDVGHGELRTGTPVIVDIFPRHAATRYCGDCTRTVVHGPAAEIPEAVRKMHAAVVEAKGAAERAARAGVTGGAVHKAACDVIRQHGYEIGVDADADESRSAMVHGTGHGIGLDVHEPPLLDTGGPELVVGDALTIEPGVYCKQVGGVRVEDMVIVGADGCTNLNSLPEGLTWK